VKKKVLEFVRERVVEKRKGYYYRLVE